MAFACEARADRSVRAVARHDGLFWGTPRRAALQDKAPD